MQNCFEKGPGTHVQQLQKTFSTFKPMEWHKHKVQINILLDSQTVCFIAGCQVKPFHTLENGIISNCVKTLFSTTSDTASLEEFVDLLVR